jgi:hypothetical protein
MKKGLRRRAWSPCCSLGGCRSPPPWPPPSLCNSSTAVSVIAASSGTLFEHTLFINDFNSFLELAPAV